MEAKLARGIPTLEDCSANKATNSKDSLDNDDPDSKISERPIAKAISRVKSPTVYCGRYYVDSPRVELKLGKISRTLAGLKLKDEESTQFSFAEKDHPNEDQMFSVGCGSGRNTFNHSKTNKSKYSTKQRKAKAIKNRHSLHNIKFNPTHQVEEVPVTKRMETKAHLKALREDYKESVEDFAMKPNPKALHLSNEDDQVENKSLGFLKYRATLSSLSVPANKTRKRLRKRYLTVPLPACVGQGIEAGLESSKFSVNNEQDDTRERLLPLVTGDKIHVATQTPPTLVSQQTVLHSPKYDEGEASTMNVSAECIEQESEKGASCEIFNESGDQREMVSTQFGKVDLVEKLVASFEEFSISQCLFFYPRHVIGRPLVFNIERDFNSHLLSKNMPFHYQTLLHTVASLSHLNLVKYLIEKRGAEVDAVDCCGRTPLMLALATPKIVRYLISAGANVNHQDKNGVCALILVATTTNCPMETVSCLLQAGADPLVSDVYGKSVVFYALHSCKVDLLQALLDLAPFLPNSRLGQLTFAGIPLFIHQMACHTPELSSLQYLSWVPDNLKLSIMYLNAISPPNKMLLSNSEYKNLYSKLVEVLKQKVKMNIAIEYPALPPLYGDRKEVETPEELRELCRDEDGVPHSSKILEFAFQCLIITERITGHGSYNSLVYLKWIVQFLIKTIKKHHFQGYGFKLDECELSMLFFKHFANMMLHHVKIAGPDTMTGNILQEAVSMIDKLKDDTKSNIETLKILQEAVLVYLRRVYTLHCHNDLHQLPDHSNLAVLLLNKLKDNGHASGLISTFVAECPRLRNGHHFQSILTKTIRVDKLLALTVIEHSGVYLLNQPDTSGEYPLHLASNEPDLVQALLEQGAHPDVVNLATSKTPLSHCGHQSTTSGKLIYKASHPSSLRCLAANILTSNQFRFQYQQADLPPHVKHFISLHDRYSCRDKLMLMEEYGFINHNFTFV